MTQPNVISPLLRPNLLPQKGVAFPKFDLRSIWEAVGFTPHAGQREIFAGWAVHQVTTAVCGTRFGKSELAAHIGLAYIAPCSRAVVVDGKRQWVDHYTRGAIIAPTFDLTKIVMEKIHRLILKLCDLLGYPKGKRKKDRYLDDDAADETGDEPGVLTVRRVNGVIRDIMTPWGNQISAFTMENPAGLLGKAFDFIITDESSQFTQGDWNNYFEYADRALLDFRGWVYHGTTPKGFNDLYDKFFVPGQPGPLRNGDYISFQMPSSKNDILFTPEDIEKKRKTTPPRLFAMNYLAQFTVLEGQVYEEFSRETHVRAFKCSVDWLYFMGMDFGFTDPFVALLMAWTGEAFVVIDEVYEPGITTAQQKKLVAQMVNRHVPKGAAWLNGKDGRWTVWGDPRGGQYRAEWAAVGVPIRKPAVRIKGQRSEIEATSQIVAEYVHPVEDLPYPEWARRPGDTLNAPQFFVHERCAETIHSFLSWVKLDNKYEGEDHACFVAGTQVLTRRGMKAIETIRPGERVLTRDGWRKVRAAGQTHDHAEIWELHTSDGRTLKGTANHPVYVNGRGFVRMDALQEGDELVCSELKALSTEASPSADILIPSGPATGATSAPTPGTFGQAWRRYTARFTGTTMDPSRMAGTSTTRTAILSTTTPTTLNASPAQSMWNTMPASVGASLPRILSILSGQERRQKRGTQVQKGLPGTLKMVVEPGRAAQLKLWTARSAAKSTTLSTGATPDFAPMPAKASGGAKPGWMTWIRRAASATQPSAPANTKKTPPVRVTAVKRSGEHAPVFNLSVKGTPEYFAEGILVHNCDASRYGIVGARHHALPKALMQARNRVPAAQAAPGSKKIKSSRLGSKGGAFNLGTR